MTELRKQIKAFLNDTEEKGTEQHKTLQEQAADLDKETKSLSKKDHAAAVDSELVMVLNEKYDFKFWQLSSYYVGNQKRSLFRNTGCLEEGFSEVVTIEFDGPSGR